MVFLSSLFCETTDLIEADSSAVRIYGSEKVTLDYLLPGEEKNAIAPLLANVAAIRFDIYVPRKGTSGIVHDVIFIRILVKEKFWVKNLSGKYEVILSCFLIDLCILLTLNLGHALKVTLCNRCIYNFLH